MSTKKHFEKTNKWPKPAKAAETKTPTSEEEEEINREPNHREFPYGYFEPHLKKNRKGKKD